MHPQIPQLVRLICSSMLAKSAARKPNVRPSTFSGRTRTLRTMPQAQPSTSAAPDIQQLANHNACYAAALEVQDKAAASLVSRLGLQPAVHPAADARGAFAASATAEMGGAAGLSAVVQAHQGGGDSPVRWLSASALASSAQDFGTTRLMAFLDASTDAPLYSLEFGVFGKTRAQGTLSLAPRADIVLNLPYLARYYTAAGEGARSGPRSWNDVYNECAARQHIWEWRHYQVPQADMKPVIANSISYTFPATEQDIQAFGEAALEVAALWAGFVQESRHHPGADASVLAQYDARYVDVVHTDPGNAIARKMLGDEATTALLQMTVGVLGRGGGEGFPAGN